MNKRYLPRHTGQVPGWAHPYGRGPFSPFLYADGGDDDGSGSGSTDTGGSGDDGTGDDDAGDDGEGDTAAKDSKAKPKPPARGRDDSTDRIGRLEKELAAARKEAAKDRTDAKKQAAQDAEKALATKVAKALGLVEDDDSAETDPAKLMDQLKQSQSTATAAQEEAIAAQVELKIMRTAFGMGVDGDKLLDSRKFCDEVDSLDPSDPKKFTAALKAAIKEAADKSPSLRLGQTAQRSGSDLSTGPNEGRNKPQRRGGLSAAIRGHYGT